MLLPGKLQVDAFLNADEFARRLAPENSNAAAIAAGRAMIKRMHSLVSEARSFAFESTLSGKTYLKQLKEWQGLGWHVSLIYLWVPSPEYSIARVAQRVREGGHSIPEEVIRRRYRSGL